MDKTALLLCCFIYKFLIGSDNIGGIATEKTFEVHYSNVDYYKRAKITTIIDFFNDIATYQSEKLGIGIDHLRENHTGWIILKWEINIKKYPLYMDKIIVRTQPAAARKVFAYRNFEILDLQGNLMVSAKSVWSLVDIKNMRPVRLTNEILEKYKIKEEKGQKYKIEEASNFSEDRINNSTSFKIRYSDIDTNGHVNNEKYAAWMIENVPKDIVLGYRLTKLKIYYKKETKYGENIEVLSQIIEKDDKIICLHKIKNNEGQLLTLGESNWEI